MTDYDKQAVNIRYRDEIAGKLPRSRASKMAWAALALFVVVILLEICWRIFMP